MQQPQNESKIERGGIFKDQKQYMDFHPSPFSNLNAYAMC